MVYILLCGLLYICGYVVKKILDNFCLVFLYIWFFILWGGYVVKKILDKIVWGVVYI
jgi:hypothetical protein